jgi:hypothetical protein
MAPACQAPPAPAPPPLGSRTGSDGSCPESAEGSGSTNSVGTAYIVRELRFFHPARRKEARSRRWDREFESCFLQRRVRKLSVPA